MLPDRMLPFWDSENNEILVEKAFPKSTKPCHWVDPVCGHKWVQRIGILTTMFERMDKGLRESVCPSCEGNVLIVGMTDLATTHPDLVQFWDSSNLLAITEVSKGSAKVVSWKCAEGHEWKRKIKDQVVKGALCKKCNRFSSPSKSTGKTLLKDSHPDLYNQINSVPDGILPEHLSSGSTRKLEWKCPKDHLYLATVTNRTLLGRGCPYCAGRYPIVGENDIATTNPEVMKFWDHETNTQLPEATKKATNKLLHWICEKQHRWTSVPANLTLNKQYCPYCSGKKLIPGETDFASVYPEKVYLWDHGKNEVKPHEVSAKNAALIHWKCPFNHEWEASVYTLAITEGTTGCPHCAGRKGLRGFNDLASLYPELLAEWNYEKNDKQPSEHSYGSGHVAWWKCAKNHEWETKINKRTGKNRINCPTCALELSVSKNEQEVYDFILTLGVQAEQSNRQLLNDGKELDIYIPSKNIAIEYNGIYWHSDAIRKDQNYHYDKWLACKDKGIQLIQIWEDEWNRNPEQIKRMLAHKLGISNERKVFARKTTVVELNKVQTELFLNENHVQGYASGSYYLGLKDKSNDELVSVLVLKNEAGTEGKTLNIIRYATSANVVGGFTKLLSYATKAYSPEGYITFSDHCVSDGGLYANHSFVADKELPPDYMYVVGNVRKHKFGYRLKRFKDDPKLLWEEGLTERELADLNGLKRIWDAGKTRWVLALDNKLM
jgi:hypothetical protein